MFGERAVAEMIKKFKKLDEGVITGKPMVVPLNPDELTDSETRQALEAMNLINKKIYGIIKGITYANGRRQKIFLKEGESVASPTIYIEGLFITILINAYEGREVATFDVLGAYLHADMTKDIYFLN